MSQPTRAEFERLTQISYLIHERFAERGHRIAQGIELDSSFGVGRRPRSALTRAMMTKAVEDAGKSVGLHMAKVPGGGRALQSFDRLVDRRYRVRLAEKLPDGSFLIKSNSRAILELSGDSMYREESWVLAYTLTASNEIDEVFVAEVLDVTEGTPGRLKLGEAFVLDPTTTLPNGFRRVEEGLAGFDDIDGTNDEEAGTN